MDARIGRSTWMLAACAAFAAVGACVKHASQHFNAAELVAWRGLISGVLVWGFAVWRGVGLRTRHPGMHAWRSAIGVVALVSWFYSLAHLPLATSMTLNYMSSLWMAAFVVGGSLLAAVAAPPGDLSTNAANASQQAQLAAVLRQQGPLLATLVMGFVGVLLVLRPSLNPQQVLAGLVGLFSGLTSAFAYLQVMALGRMGEPEERTVFYFAVGCAVAGLLALPVTGVSPWPGWQGLWLLPIGALAALGQWAMTRAYASGSTLLVANFQYSGVVFAAGIGAVWFGERPPLVAWMGIALVILSAMIATYLRALNAQKSATPE